ncbi:MAG: acyl-CoA dehydrogenase family protein [Hyphomicrobiaceae bacterium]
MNDDRPLTQRHAIYTEEDEALRQQIVRFCREEIEPHGEAWEEAGTFPRELYEKAGRAGLLGISFPEELGGSGGDLRHYCLVREELSRTGFAGVRVGLMVHGIGLPPVIRHAPQPLKEMVAPEVLSGRKLICLAISEPNAGSDVANIITTATRDGADYIVNGEKAFISNGVRADYYTTAVRTGGPGRGGLSILLIPRDTPGLTQTPLKKIGWWTSDTAIVHFDNCRVPAAHIVGEENRGFMAIMHNFNLERLGIAASMLGSTRCLFAETRAYVAERQAYGQALREHQVVRHKLVDMSTSIQAMEAMLDNAIWKVLNGDPAVSDISRIKAFFAQEHERCAADAVQLHGGAGMIRGIKVERIFRESKILSIGGGSTEVMKDLVARQEGI